MRTYRLYDFANPISVAITNPSQSGYSRFVGLEHYDSGELVVKRYSGTELLTTTAKAFEKNDILIARRNVYLKRAGIVFFDGITSGDSIVLRIKEDCKSITGVPKELAQRIVPIVLNSEQFWKYANKHADGMNSKRISKEMLLAYEFELPSLEEQRVLADKLWAAYEVKESYKNLLAQTDKLLHAQFQKMFGERWEHKTLGEIGTFQRGGGFQKNDFVEGGIPCIHYGQIHTKFGPYISSHLTEISSDLESKVKYAAKGDLLIAITSEDEEGSCKSTAWLGNYNVAVGGHAAIFHHNMNPLFMSYYFKSSVFNAEKVKYLRGSKVIEIKPDDIAKIHVPIPPMELQKQFAETAEQAEQTKASLNKGIEAIEAVIRSLIAEGTTKV